MKKSYNKTRFLTLSNSLILIFTLISSLLLAFITNDVAEVIGSTPITSRNFYIDPINGDDSFDGTSTTYVSGSTGPWKTLKNIDKKSTFKGGDTIHLKSGGEWDLRSCADYFLEFRSSGTASNPITITSYGNGSKPILNGHYPGTGSPYGDTVDINGDYVTVNGLEIKNTWSYGIVTQLEKSKHYGVTIKNCYIHDTGRVGIYGPFGEFKLVIHNNTIKNTGLRAGGGGIAIEGDGNYHGSDIEISYNIIINPYGDGITLHEGGSVWKNHLGTNISIHHNVVSGSINGDAIDLTTGSKVKVYNNILNNCNSQLIHTDSSFKDGEIFNNIIWGNASTGSVFIAVSNISFHNNIIMIDEGITPYALNINSDNYHNFPVKNIDVFRNTFIYDDSMTHSGLIEIADGPGTLGKVSINSNIFTTQSSSPANYLIHFQYNSYPASDPDFSCNGNIYGPGKFNIRDRSSNIDWNKWTSTFGHDKNGSIGDPGITFLSDHTYSLNESSICIDAGLECYSGDSIDPLGTPIYGLPDVGAIEYRPNHIMGLEPVVLGSQMKVFNDGRFRYLTPPGNGTLIDFSMSSTDWTKCTGQRIVQNIITIDDSRPIGKTVISWRETDLSLTKKNSYIIGKLLPNERFTVHMDGYPQFVVLSDGNGTLHFEIEKPAWEVNITITNEDRPMIEGFDVPGTIGTGQDLEFTIVASDMEGVLDSKIIYGVPGTLFIGTLQLVLVEGDERFGKWVGSLPIPTTLIGELNYTISLTDINGLITRSRPHFVSIIDIIPPVLVEDLTPDSVAPGFPISFKFSLYDNIGIDTAHVELNEGNVTIVQELTRSNEYYSNSMEVGIKTQEYIYYTLNITDEAGNVNTSPLVMLKVLDINSPFIVHDSSDKIAYTGNLFNIDIEITDDRGMNRSYVEIFLGDSVYRFDSENGFLVNINVNIPNDFTGILDYVVYAEDLSGNRLTDYRISVPVLDDEPPVLIKDLTPDSGTTGDPFVFCLEAGDNIGIRDVSIEYWTEEGFGGNLSLTVVDGQFHGILPNGPSGPGLLNYRIHIFDLSSNELVVEVQSVIFIDNDPPVLHALPITVRSESKVSFSVEASDNSGLVYIYLIMEEDGDTTEWEIPNSNGTFLMDITLYGKKGILTFHFRAEDPAGNVATTPSILLEVTENGEVIAGPDQEVPIFKDTEGEVEGKDDDEGIGPAPSEDNNGIMNEWSVLIIGSILFMIVMLSLVIASFFIGRVSADRTLDSSYGSIKNDNDESIEETELPVIDRFEPIQEQPTVSDASEIFDDYWSAQNSLEEYKPADMDDIIKQLDDLHDSLNG